MRQFKACILFVVASRAFGLSEMVGIQEKAQGQSLGGANLLNDSIFSNPASSTFSQVYCVDAFYASSKSFSASVLDTRTSDMGGGLGYFRKPTGFGQTFQGAKMSLGFRAERYLGVGFAGKILWGPNAAGEHRNLKDADVGLLANLGILQLGLTTRNVFGGDPTLDQNREMALGGRLNYNQILFFSMTAVSKWGYLNPYQYGLGAEFITPYYFALRGGYRVQPKANQSFWSGGLGLLAPRISINYSFEIPNHGTNEVEHLIGATLNL